MAASITVVNNRGRGSVEGGEVSQNTKLLQQILQEIRQSNKSNLVASRKAESGGFLRGATTFGAGELAGAGLLGRFGAGALGIGGGALGGLGGLISTVLGIPGSTQTAQPNQFVNGRGNLIDTSFTSGIGPNGDRTIFEIDRQTGAILDSLTEQEAEQNGILDATGKIFDKYQDIEAEQKSILASLDKSRDSYILTSDILEVINNNLITEDGIYRDIVALRERQRKALSVIVERLEKQARISGGDSGINYSPVPGATPNFLDLANNVARQNSERRIQEWAESVRNDEFRPIPYLDIYTNLARR